MNPRTRFQVLILAAVIGGTVPLAAHGADYLDTIGMRSLRAGGYLVANGAGVAVAQVESGSGAYAPNRRHPEFRGKTIRFEGITSSPSDHATGIGRLIYGSGSGIAPGVGEVYSYSDASFVGTRQVRGLLNPWRGKRPGTIHADVINNSWAGSFQDYSLDLAAVRRMDYAIWREDVVVVSSTYNEPWRTSLPPLMASSYNGITVGRTSGSRGGPATFDGGAGRAKPDLVAPMGTTSDAAAVVSGAAALLLSEAEARHMRPDALAVKSLLMAGAHRPADWRPGGDGSVAGTVPLSYAYGAGELRVNRAFHIMSAGEQKENRSAFKRGWSSGKLSGKKDDYYDLKYSSETAEFTAVLTWHRRFSKRGRSYDNLAPVLADLELELLRRVKKKKWTLFARSDSAVDNVEMIAIDNLPAGQYRLAVGGAAKNEYYGLAWDADSTASAAALAKARMSAEFAGSGGISGEPYAGGFVATPEPSGLLLWLPALGLMARRRRRRR